MKKALKIGCLFIIIFIAVIAFVVYLSENQPFENTEALIQIDLKSKKLEEIAAFEFDNAWYWIYTFSADATTDDFKAEVKRYANPRQTSWFFFYPDSESVGYYATTPFNLNKLRYNLLNNPRASHGYVKIPKQPLDTLGLLYIDY